MKKLLIYIVLLILPAVAMSQTAADKLFDKYAGQDGFTTVYITKYMFSMFADMETNDEDFDELVKNLNSIKILAVDDSETISGINFYTEIMKDLPLDEYNELMVIKEKGQDIKFLIKERDGRIIELLLIAGGEESNALISIQGNIDLKNISKLSKSMNIDGFEHLEGIDEEKKK